MRYRAKALPTGILVILLACPFELTKAEPLRCLSLVETGQLLDPNEHYYDRFDGVESRVITVFDFELGVLQNYRGKQFQLTEVSREVFVLKIDPRYKYLVHEGGKTVVEARVDKDAVTLKIFECEKAS